MCFMGFSASLSVLGIMLVDLSPMHAIWFGLNIGMFAAMITFGLLKSQLRGDIELAFLKKTGEEQFEMIHKAVTKLANYTGQDVKKKVDQIIENQKLLDSIMLHNSRRIHLDFELIDEAKEVGKTKLSIPVQLN